MAVLVEYVPTFSPGLNFPPHTDTTPAQCTAAMPLFIKLLLGRESLEKKENKPRQKERQFDSCCCWRRVLRCLHKCH